MKGMSLPSQMQAIRFIPQAGTEKATKDAPADIQMMEHEVPTPLAGEVLIKVEAAGINNADLLQRSGGYNVPEGASDIPGLEVAGKIAALGEGVTAWDVDDRVCALLAGGGYAEYVAVDARQVVPVPEQLDVTEAAGIVETAATVWFNVFMTAQFQPGDWVLIHGGAGGIGTTAIQMVKAMGGKPIATAGSDAKVEYTEFLGAHGINYRTENFVDRVHEITDGHGVDIILDIIAGHYADDNMKVLAHRGRWVVIGTQGGIKGEVNFLRMMAKQAVLTGNLLRPRTAAEKGEILAGVVEHIWPLLADGSIDPLIAQSFPLAETAAAYERFSESDRVGKIVLTM
ncbi:putative PIG3 family NAD(P)H quinone oxidoreductase [Enteractinococcus coprophilus]|uniref:Putative PIG3 family NAD(P)H quinone oxidoreductase n=2 Tax=Enteractinococcus coprophilus TaxID=1027633 RepID=A0A543AFY5_9MICC|nr:putative PIG3 family NAD(P)H quinone oxidoreductase [Enteractinococcus coprophilus]